MLLVALLVLATEPLPLPECQFHRDCVISTFGGCCASGCPVSPHAIPRDQEAARQKRCTIVDCSARREEPRQCVTVEPASAFNAVCLRHVCKMVRVNTTGGCTSDSECRVDWVQEDTSCAQSPCGCCPGGTPIAVSTSTPPPKPPPAPQPLTKKDEKPPPFGLSQGGAPPPRLPPPKCEPCPPQPVVRAACSEGRCTLLRE